MNIKHINLIKQLTCSHEKCVVLRDDSKVVVYCPTCDKTFKESKHIFNKVLDFTIPFIIGCVITLLIMLSFHVQAESVTPPNYSNMQGKHLSTIDCLTVNLYHESRSESDIANIMILNVVMNRVDDRRFPSTPCEVVFAEKAFSWTSDGKSDKVTDIVSYNRLYRLVEYYLLNKKDLKLISEGVNHYHTVTSNPYWSTAYGYNYVTTIDNHKFYRWN